MVFANYLKTKVEDEERINNLKGGTILGSNEFVEKIKDYFKKQEKELEIPTRERLVIGVRSGIKTFKDNDEIKYL